MRRKLLRICIFCVLAIVVTVAAAVVYLLSTDFSMARGFTAKLASKAAGRRVTIDGTFRLHVGRTLHLSAGRIVVANAPGGSSASFASIGQLDVAIETRSLLRGPVHIERIEARDVELHLESDRRGRNNWRLGAPRPAHEATGPPALPQLDTVVFRGFHLSYAAPGRARQFDVALDNARFSMSPKEMIALALEGRIDGQPLHLEGHAGPLKSLLAGTPFTQELSFELGTVTGTLHGRTASLSTLAGSSLDLALGGPDIAVLAQIFGLPDLGRGPFHLRATARPAGKTITTTFEAEAPLMRGSGTGTVTPGTPPAFDLSLMASGKNLGALGVLAGIHDLPNGPFAARGRVRAHGFPAVLDHVTIRAGPMSVAVDGQIGKPPTFAGTGLAFDVRHAGVALIQRFAGLELPAGPVSARGRMKITGRTIRIDRLTASAGRNRVRGSATISRGGKGVRAHVRASASGPDLAAWSTLAGTRLPPGPFEVSGTIRIAGNTLDLHTVTGTFAAVHFSASGTIVPAHGGAGTTLAIRTKGGDLASLRRLTGVRQLPAGPFRAAGTLTVGPESLVIGKLDASCVLGSATGSVGLARPPAAGPITLDLHVTGSNFGAFAPLAGLVSLPAGPFDATGTVGIGGKTITLSGVHLAAGDLDLSASGRIVRGPGLRGTRLDARISGRHLPEIGAVLGGKALPDIPFSLSGAIKAGTTEDTLRRLEVTLGTARIAVDGTISPPGRPLRLALRLDAAGTDPADVIRCLNGFGITVPKLPARPFSLSGELKHDAQGFHFSTMHLGLGTLRADVDGRLGAPPSYRDTDLQIEASGGNAVNLQELTGRRFEVEGLRFDGRVRSLARVDGSSGPRLGFKGALAAKRLALGEPPQHGSASKKAGKRQGKRLFSTAPLRMALPTLFEGTFDCRIGELQLPQTRLTNAHLTMVLDREGLRLGPIDATVGKDGKLTGTFRLSSSKERLSLQGQLELAHLRLGLLFGTPAQEHEPPLDIRVDIHTSGRSLHELAAAADGRFSLTAGAGRIPSSMLDRFAGSLLMKIVDAINPFQTSDPMTALDCAAVAGVITDGHIVLGPLGLQTSKVTTVAAGTIDLGTEKPDITFTTQSRRGLGISAGTLANAYLKVGGTLAEPSLELRPLSAVASTGLAVATGGLSWLARGLWNRVQAEADTCAQMHEEITTLWQGKAPPPTPDAGRK